MECGICKTKLSLLPEKDMRKKKYITLKIYLQTKLCVNLFDYVIEFLGEGSFFETTCFIVMFWNCPCHQKIKDFKFVLNEYLANDIDKIDDFFLRKQYNESEKFCFFENMNLKMLINRKFDPQKISPISFYLEQFFYFFYKKYQNEYYKPILCLTKFKNNKMLTYYFQKRFNLISSNNFFE
jgi:hypothetical protein